MAAEPEDGSAPEAESKPGLVRRVLRGVVAVLGLFGVAGAAGVIALLFPYVRDDMRLDRVVRAVALEWRDFGRERALEKLAYELDHQEVGGAVGEDACALELDDDIRRVTCSWAVRIALPVGGNVPLSFSSVAEIDSTGDLR